MTILWFYILSIQCFLLSVIFLFTKLHNTVEKTNRRILFWHMKYISMNLFLGINNLYRGNIYYIQKHAPLSILVWCIYLILCPLKYSYQNATYLEDFEDLLCPCLSCRGIIRVVFTEFSLEPEGIDVPGMESRVRFTARLIFPSQLGTKKTW